MNKPPPPPLPRLTLAPNPPPLLGSLVQVCIGGLISSPRLPLILFPCRVLVREFARRPRVNFGAKPIGPKKIRPRLVLSFGVKPIRGGFIHLGFRLHVHADMHAPLHASPPNPSAAPHIPNIPLSKSSCHGCISAGPAQSKKAYIDACSYKCL